MGLSKTTLFTERQNRVAELAKALAHPARVAILDVLLRQKECVCGVLVDELPLAQATVSQHLKVLKDAGLIRGEIEGPRSCYCIDPDNWALAAALLGDFLHTQPFCEGDTCC